MNQLEKINSQIADCLSGNGDFEQLRRLQAEKADILDREHFDKIQAVKDEISDLETQRVADFRAEEILQSQLKSAAMVVDEKAASLQVAREAHGTLNGLIFLKKTALDVSREEIRAKKAELSNLINSKILEQN